MHFNLRAALGIAVPVLLGSALAAGALALPAHAQSYQDTALSATAVQADKFGGSGLGAEDSTTHTDIDLTGTRVTWLLHGTAPTGVQLSGSTISCSGCTAGPAELVADATDSAGNAEALELPVTLTENTILLDGTPTPVILSGLADTNTAGAVTFSADSSVGGDTISFSESQLPTGLVSGNPTLTYVGGTAAPGTYTGVVATATDSDGAVLNGTFTLTVDANTINTYGDEVNIFGNGFDVFRQHDYAGAIIAGWPATQTDPAVDFDLNNGTHTGAYQFEYAPGGTASGLCVSDPGGGWASDPLRDGLILAPCNTGPWQQFFPQSDGSLVNVATGLFVNPDGKGAQLRGEGSTASWGGSSYTWTAQGDLPG
jgi:hypothetical protein